jgi:hypothetical protein
MSAISFREWEVWKNDTFFASPATLQGQFGLSIVPSLMARQTVEFILGLIERIRLGTSAPPAPAGMYLSPLIYRRPAGDGQMLMLYKLEPLDTSAWIPSVLATLLDELQTLSLCLDFPLTCHAIEYEVPPGQPSSGKAFVATRKPLVRGLAFEVDERAQAEDNVLHHFDAYATPGDQTVRIASNHYQTGMTLLGLEDQYPGLIDAAFMQFYQACETLLLAAPRETVDDAKKRIAADPRISNGRDLQIIVAHVWKVRHKFFGHRAIAIPQSASDVFQIAKQVLVARWLCRFLIDRHVGAPGLCREMRLYHENNSEEFRGTVSELETAFNIPGGAGENVVIFDASGSGVETYVTR